MTRRNLLPAFTTFTLLALAAALFAACSPPTPQTSAPTQAVAESTSAPEAGTQGVQATSLPAPTLSLATSTVAGAAETEPPTAEPFVTPTSVSELPTAIPTTEIVSPTAIAEARLVEVEWPATLRLGESDLVRLSLAPTKDGYVVTAEFQEHRVATQTVPVPRPGGYDLSALARLDGVGFDLSPTGEQAQGLPLNEPVTWRWTLTPRAAGQQRLSLTLKLRWTPSAGRAGAPHERMIYSKGLSVQVESFWGLTRGQAMGMGLLGLMVGGSLSLPLAVSLVLRRSPRRLPLFAPNQRLTLEKPPTCELSAAEESLLRTLFRRYGRVTLEAEFRSGYSGARTFLALPVREDGRADAYTIAKLGERAAIQQEYENYERYVKDTLPPITARIQETPVATAAGGGVSLAPARPRANWMFAPGGGQAALRYTFIGEAGKSPTSLRERLLADPDPRLLEQLFATFGPNWWMQRKPYTFRLAQEYDRLLPAHYVLAPTSGASGQPPTRVLDGRQAPDAMQLQVGEVVSLRHWQTVERHVEGQALSLRGEPPAGQPPLRARWASLTPPSVGVVARVTATRETLLREWVAGFDRGGLPDPLLKLPQLLNERVMGTQSTIHGDLNVENILLGPGNFLWLIDFAQTREGHPLYDFAHLAAEIIAHVLAPQLRAPAEILPLLDPNSQSLIAALSSIAARCLFNPAQPREYQLALCLACLGALKYVNLNAHQKHVLYLAAAHTAQAL